MSKTSIKERNKAIRLAWEREQGLVSEGKGTRDWTEAQQRDILDPDKGKAYDDNGRAFEGQHMKSAAEYPEYQGDPDNIQFLTREEHLEAHKGSWQNPTNWYYNPETKEFVDFGENKPTPCEKIQLSDPIAVQMASPVAEQDGVETVREREASSETSDEPDSIPTKNETRKMATSAAAKERRIQKEDRSFGDKLLGVVDAIKGFGERHPVIAGIAKGVGIVGGTIVAAVVHEAVSGNGSSGKGSSRSSTNYYPSSGREDNYDSSSEPEDDYFEPSTKRDYPDERASPDEHTVPAHGQHYHTKDGVIWKEKESYQRGGKHEDD